MDQGVPVPTTSSEAPDGGSAVTIEHVHKWFGQFRVLWDVSLTVQAGERVVICGPSGSGKSTLLRCINALEDYQQGRGISYGSLYNYDVRVPLFFYGPQFRAGVYDAPVESIDVAPTLARLLGVDQPSSCTGHVLSEAFVP